MKVVFLGWRQLLTSSVFAWRRSAGDSFESRLWSTQQSHRSLKAFCYLALAAYEHGSILPIGVRREVIRISLKAVIFWRGNCPHAGSVYKMTSSRVFISIPSSLCSLTSAVYIVQYIRGFCKKWHPSNSSVVVLIMTGVRKRSTSLLAHFYGFILCLVTLLIEVVKKMKAFDVYYSHFE